MTKPLPHDFIQQMTTLIGATEAQQLFSALQQTEPSTSIRRNPLKTATPATGLFENQAATPVPWCAEGAYLSERPSFILDPTLHGGAYYVQEAASMFLEQAVRRILSDATPQRVLDLCAAPGGKSTLWRSLLPEGTLLVANEPMRQRADILAENMLKWGHPDVVVTNAYPNEFQGLNSFFDVIGSDVPCSGEGMFRKDDVAISEWSAQNVIDCVSRQWQIVCDIWDSLRQGGYMVYSTCTFNRMENEDMVRRICTELGAEVVALPVEAAWNVHTLSPEGKVVNAAEANNGMYHFYPHKSRGEGLFLCLLRKTAEAPLMKQKKTKPSPADKVQIPAEARRALSWLQSPETFQITTCNATEWAAVRQSLAADVALLQKQVRCLTAGIPLAELKGKKLVPLHGLALSTQLAADAFPRCEVALNVALAYLHREAIQVDAPTGWTLVCYKGLPLGFVNNLGNRANNQYPQAWRIRRSI